MMMMMQYDYEWTIMSQYLDMGGHWIGPIDTIVIPTKSFASIKYMTKISIQMWTIYSSRRMRGVITRGCKMDATKSRFDY